MRRVLIFVFPGHQALDVTGPADVLVLTNSLCKARGVKTPPYDIMLCAPEKGLVGANGGVMRFYVDHGIDDFSDADLAGVDTLMIAGGSTAIQLRHDPKVMGFLKRATSLSGRVASVCTGAFLLANTGYLSGHSVATHWWSSRQLEHEYPDVDVNSDAITLRSGRFWSSGGVSSGIDLALAMVEADLGADIARAAARAAVAYLNRPGGQLQFSAPRDPEPAIEPPAQEQRITEIINFIRANPTADLRRASLADRFNITEKTLARRGENFAAMPLSHLVEQVRVSWAQLHLESSDDTLEEIAAHSGFKSADTMRRVFVRRISVTPTVYRDRFKSALLADGLRLTDPDGDHDSARCPETSDFCPSAAAAE